MMNKKLTLHPATLFFVMTLVVAVVVWLLDIYGVSVYNPATESYLQVQSLFNPEGIRWLLRHLISNFGEFAPISMVVVSLLGLGVAEHSGFLSSFCRKMPQNQYTPTIGIVVFIFLGLLSNVLGDSGYVFLLPLVILLSPRLGIDPLLAIIVTYVSVASGYSANIVLSSMDPLLAKITAETTASYQPQNFNTGTYSNYYFMFASTWLLLVVIYVVGIKILKPRLVKAGFKVSFAPVAKLSQRERRALRLSVIVGCLFLGLVLWLTFSPLGLFRGVSGHLVRSPFIMGALLILSLTIGMMGLIYGLFSGKYRSDQNVVSGMGYFVKEFSLFFVIAFFAAQFFSCLNYTKVDQFVVLYIGHIVASLEVSKTLLLILFIFYCALVNLVMVSAVGKWTLIAPIFIPLFFSIGIYPDEVQAAYRVGESSTNPITPFLYYLPFVLVLLKKYTHQVSFVFLCKNTWYFSVIILIVWMAFYMLWHALKLPFGI